MRIDINLASQPYEDARQFWMRWGTALGVLGLLTLVLLALDATGWWTHVVTVWRLRRNGR